MATSTIDGSVTAEDERWGVLGGVVFVVLDVAVAVLGGEPPASDAGRVEITRYLSGHGAGIEAGLWLFGLAAVALMWWMGSLWRRMVRAERGSARLAVVSLAGLTVAGSLSLAAAAILAAAGARVDDLGATVTVVHSMSVLLLAASGFGVATHLLATSVLGARTGTLPSWVVGVGVLAALLFLGSAVLTATAGGGTADAVGVLGFALWCLWILAVSAVMWRDVGDRLAVVAA